MKQSTAIHEKAIECLETLKRLYNLFNLNEATPSEMLYSMTCNKKKS